MRVGWPVELRARAGAGSGALLVAAVVRGIVFFVPLDFLGGAAFVGFIVVVFGWFGALERACAR